jgi:transposase
MDVHAETIAAAIAEPDGEVRSLGTIPNRMESVRKLIKKLGPVEKLRVCYEAGPTGYVLYWQLAELGVQCEVIVPSLVPVKAGDRVKTDRRDAEKLARSYRSGDLTAVWVPTRVPRRCAIWCVRVKRPSRMSCELVIGWASFYCVRVIVRRPE